MTNEQAIHKLEYSKRAYQMLIDEKVQEGVLVGQGINAEWSADTPIIDAYKDMLEACDMAIKALETLEEFEKAQIITGGRLNGRTYAYKCGLEDGKRKALEQEPKVGYSEPFINKPCISQGVCHEDKVKVLDKIRVEIQKLPDINPDYSMDRREHICKGETLQIIDKYRKGGE